MSGDATGRSALITGGAGFIGSHLAELLLADGWEVFVLDDLSTGSERNVAHLRERRDFHLVVDSDGKPTRIGYRVDEETGKRVRISKRNGKDI